MSFQLSGVVPWGRNIGEYREMFLLGEYDFKKRIAGFGDGPASFNRQATELGADVTSFDPIYRFSVQQLRTRINEVKEIVLRQMSENSENYVWERIRDIGELERVRMSAMEMFLEDYERSRSEGRYVCHELPNPLPYEDGTFDIGLSSHFLLMYTELGYDFHIAAIREMLRVCKEVRIFPLCYLDGRQSELTERVIGHFGRDFDIDIQKTDYEFQRGANKLLKIVNK